MLALTSSKSDALSSSSIVGASNSSRERSGCGALTSIGPILSVPPLREDSLSFRGESRMILGQHSTDVFLCFLSGNAHGR